jgi:RNA polymerase sigma-70 factor (ECF subfamily)
VGVTDEERARRWALVVPHEARLLAIARRLVRDRGDAEACVQEAMLRCATFPTLDESNVAGFLVTTVRRLCVDHHRRHAHDGRVAAKLTGTLPAEAAPEDAVCDRAEAAWVSTRLADLPARQRDAVLARAEGRSVGEIATLLDVSYKTVETLLYRVRTRVRADLQATYGSVLLAISRRPRLTRGSAGVLSAGVASAMLVGSAMLVPHPHHQDPAAVPPARGLYLSGPVASRTPTPEPSPEPGPAAAPAVPPASPGRPPAPHPTGSPPPFRCPDPPYWADPCVSPNPSETPGLAVLDCLFYGIDREVGFHCNPSPTPSAKEHS